MRLWKSRSPGSRPEKKKEEDFISRIRKDIQRVRRQGDSPTRDPASFSRYSCDLCNDTFPKKDLRQCALCGRWACASCWTENYYACKACNGIITLHLTTDKPGE